MVEWQPIETAPKDGSLVLLWAKPDEFTVGYFDSPSWKYSKTECCCCSGYCSFSPDYWAPLPKKPEETR